MQLPKVARACLVCDGERSDGALVPDVPLSHHIVQAQNWGRQSQEKHYKCGGGSKPLVGDHLFSLCKLRWCFLEDGEEGAVYYDWNLCKWAKAISGRGDPVML
jgi:hypothetical protein